MLTINVRVAAPYANKFDKLLLLGTRIFTNCYNTYVIFRVTPNNLATNPRIVPLIMFYI